ncbi:LysR family transcriptional regulator [Pseudonocardia sp. TRM90224]|uniref:LysR family transcriptional regulator n=1 Tax=Pseudonocardia sp. TRM90224 TaxID=2812678 RepID=UPI002103FA20|nr:LysR family transcriptional regulator [Pseudonocardia sp. TRM90224]
MLNPIHLLTLRTVLAHGSFARAAVELGYTTPAVSQQVSALERATGLVLFERLPRGIRATPAASYLATAGSEIVNALVWLERDAVAIATGRRGEIRLGSFPTASQRIVPAALAHFAAANPESVVSFDQGTLEELLAALTEGPLDVAVVYENDLGTPPLPSGLEAVHLLTERRHLLLPAEHRLGGNAAIDLGDLAGETWIASKTSPLLNRMCTSAGFEPRIAHRTDDFDVMHEFVRHGLGIALVPALGHVPGPGIVTVPLTVTPPTRRVYAVHRRSNENPLLAQLIDALREGVRLFRVA